MKKRPGLVLIIVMIVGVVILLFSDQIEFTRDEARVKYEEGLAKIRREEVDKRRRYADDGLVYDENAPSGDDQRAQYAAEYIDSLKDIFDKNKHLLESGDDVDLALDLKMFKQGDEYHFGDMFWNISFEQVANGVEYALLEDPDRTSDSDGYTYYVSAGKYVLYGQTATSTFGFHEDQLKTVQLNFIPDGKKKVQAFYDSVVETLIDICGHESVKEESGTTEHVSHQWEAEGTMLQVELIDSSVVIFVGLMEVL